MYHKHYSSIRDKPVQCLACCISKPSHHTPHMYIMLCQPRINSKLAIPASLPMRASTTGPAEGDILKLSDGKRRKV